MNKFALSYTPFDKDWAALEAADLSALRTATEGWYVEYKREASSSTAIAKSISAFANTYGGWLFYGVEEKSRDDPVAGNFPGIDVTDVDPTLQRIRQACAAHVNPTPHFETKVVRGRCEQLGLAADRAVVVVRTPWSLLAPHVHKNGSIYRRVADGSEPKPENDRTTLDQLWRRGDDLRRDYKEWVDRDPEFSQDESKLPYVRLLLVADLWRDRDLWMDATIDEVREMFAQPTGTVAAVPFDTVQTSAEGFVARQLANNDPQGLTLTWRLRQSLVSDVIFPLPLYSQSNLDILEYQLHGYEGAARFVEVLRKRSHSTVRVVDLTYLFALLIGIVEIQRRLMRKAGWPGSYFFKVRLLNFWRTIPFLDVPVILDGFEKHGVPMCLDGKVTSLRGSDPDTFLEVSSHTDVDDEAARIYLQALALFAPIARIFGVPAWISHEPDSAATPYINALQQASERAMVVQRLRNARANT